MPFSSMIYNSKIIMNLVNQQLRGPQLCQIMSMAQGIKLVHNEILEDTLKFSIVTGFAKRSCMCNYKDLEKYRFEICNAVYLGVHGASSMQFSTILHNSVVIRDNSINGCTLQWLTIAS